MDDAACREWLKRYGTGAEYNLGGNVHLNRPIDTNFSPNEIATRSVAAYNAALRTVPAIISRNTADRIKNNSRRVYNTKNVITFFIILGRENEFKSIVTPEKYSRPKGFGAKLTAHLRNISWTTFVFGYFTGAISIIALGIWLSR